MSIPNPYTNFKVFSLVADSMAASGKIFWYVWNVDTQGSGRVTVKIKDVAKYFDVFVQTVYRWLSDAREKGYIYDYWYHRNGTVTVRYVSYKVFPRKFGLDSLGQVVWCDRDQMRDLKPTVTIAELKTKQNQSLYMSKKANKTNVGKADYDWRKLSYEDRIRFDLLGEVRTVWRGLNSIFKAVKAKKKEARSLDSSLKPVLKQKPTVDNSDKKEVIDLFPKITRRKKVLLHCGKRFVIVTHKMTGIGVSQQTLADAMNRGVKTIQRRTKAIERRQILRVLPVSPDTGEYMQRDNTKILVHGGIVYEVCPNVYNIGNRYETSSAYIYTKRAKEYQQAKDNLQAR
jgi:hypothetical protein